MSEWVHSSGPRFHSPSPRVPYDIIIVKTRFFISSEKKTGLEDVERECSNTGHVKT
jgi:hypothetical protein